MRNPAYTNHQNHLALIRKAIHAAADPALAVTRALSHDAGMIYVAGTPYTLPDAASLYLIAFGKASSAMTSAATGIVGNRLTAGVVSLPAGASLDMPGVDVFHGGHPLPDSGSIAAGRAIGSLLEHIRPDDLVLILISGGGSAMLEWPLEGINLADFRRLTGLLLQCGAPIEEINIVRKAISRIKAGGIARLAAPARCVSLILSDVVGDRLTAIASGPTVLRRVSHDDARQVLTAYHIWDRVPESIRDALSREQQAATTAPRPHNHLIGSNRLALTAALSAAEDLGFTSRIISRQMHGEARIAGARFARRILHATPGSCLIMGGETTVTIQGNGKGGRNQEFALAASLALPEKPPRVVMSLATDGVDGPTDAAGAVVTSETQRLAAGVGLDLHSALENNDSYSVLDPLNALIKTGPSGTNVNDIVIGLAYP